MISRDDVNALIQGITQGHTECKLYLIQRRRKADELDYQVFRTQIEQGVSSELANILLRSLTKVVEDPETEFTEYTPSFVPETQIQVCPLSDVSYAQAILEQMQDETQLPWPTMNSGFVQGLWGYAVRVVYSSGFCTYFCKSSPGKVLTRGGILNLVCTSAGHFEKLEGDVFRISDHIDCVEIDGQILILNERGFESVFSYVDMLAQGVRNYFAAPSLQSYFSPGDLESFADQICRDMRKMRKLHAILSSELLPQLDRNKARERAEQLGLQVNFSTETGQVVLEGTNLWHLLRLLDEDYLTGDLSGTTYEVTSKRKYIRRQTS